MQRRTAWREKSSSREAHRHVSTASSFKTILACSWGPQQPPRRTYRCGQWRRLRCGWLADPSGCCQRVEQRIKCKWRAPVIYTRVDCVHVVSFPHSARVAALTAGGLYILCQASPEHRGLTRGLLFDVLLMTAHCTRLYTSLHRRQLIPHHAPQYKDSLRVVHMCICRASGAERWSCVSPVLRSPTAGHAASLYPATCPATCHPPWAARRCAGAPMRQRLHVRAAAAQTAPWSSHVGALLLPVFAASNACRPPPRSGYARRPCGRLDRAT